MRKHFLIGFGALAALGLAACSERSQDQAGQTANAIGSDVERGVNNADDTIAAGADKAGRSLDNAGHEIGAAADRIGSSVENHAASAKKDLGSALEKAGNDIKD